MSFLWKVIAEVWCFVVGHDKVSTVTTEMTGGPLSLTNVMRWYCVRCKRQL